MKRYIPQVSSATKTYATEANAEAAVQKAFGEREDLRNQTYIIMQADNGRWVPVFIGERAVQALIHFRFHVLA